QCSGILVAAHAAADLHGHVHRTEDGGDECAVVAAAECRVQVDDVQHRKAVGDPAARDADGVGKGYALGFGPAADELHDAPAAQVECGHGDHVRASARKLARRRRPGAPLFSGWNWTPSVRPARTAAGKRSAPYCDQATTLCRAAGSVT